MKNLLSQAVILLLFLPLACFASSDNFYFKINIKNNTPETCFLTHKNLFHGHISKFMPLPEKILSGTEHTFFIEETGLSATTSISLTYLCGGLHSISFLSSREKPLISSEDIITGQILTAVDMDAIFEVEHGTTYGGLFSGKHGTISWILS
ncbi:MAG: hypothetical protein ACO1N3_02470 [Gammaproteobacteria bacterium]